MLFAALCWFGGQFIFYLYALKGLQNHENRTYIQDENRRNSAGICLLPVM